MLCGQKVACQRPNLFRGDNNIFTGNAPLTVIFRKIHSDFSVIHSDFQGDSQVIFIYDIHKMPNK
jgi:hypothetical protein